MVAAVVASVALMMVFAGAIGRFVSAHPTIKMLALSFLFVVGVALIAEGFDKSVPKGYIYFAMAFSVVRRDAQPPRAQARRAAGAPARALRRRVLEAWELTVRPRPRMRCGVTCRRWNAHRRRVGSVRLAVKYGIPLRCGGFHGWCGHTRHCCEGIGLSARRFAGTIVRAGAQSPCPPGRTRMATRAPTASANVSTVSKVGRA